MAQAINVVAMRKQITTKLTALETSIDAYNTARDKYEADYKAAKEKYEKDLAVWNLKAAKALLGSAKDVENLSIDIRGGSAATIYLNGVDLSKLTPRPTFNVYGFKEDVQKKNGELYKAIPVYFDAYHRPISLDAVKSHFRKALEMLDVLPAGTVEIQVKDFNFLTKF
jgi:hypothetical protein